MGVGWISVRDALSPSREATSSPFLRVQVRDGPALSIGVAHGLDYSRSRRSSGSRLGFRDEAIRWLHATVAERHHHHRHGWKRRPARARDALDSLRDGL